MHICLHVTEVFLGVISAQLYSNLTSDRLCLLGHVKCNCLNEAQLMTVVNVTALKIHLTILLWYYSHRNFST